MSKVHYRNDLLLSGAPAYVVDDYTKKGEHGAFCGYVRKNTTFEMSEVTCFYCLNKLRRENSLEYFMSANGLGPEDMINDITMPQER